MAKTYLQLKSRTKLWEWSRELSFPDPQNIALQNLSKDKKRHDTTSRQYKGRATVMINTSE